MNRFKADNTDLLVDIVHHQRVPRRIRSNGEDMSTRPQLTATAGIRQLFCISVLARS